MWNRVVLLSAGVALGWSLVTWLSASEERLARARGTMGLAALVGLGLTIWLGLENLAAAFVGAFVFGLGALATYATRAKQLLRVTEVPLPPPKPTPESPAERLAVLIAPGPPPNYSAESLSRLQAAGALPPSLGVHWFVAPAAYARIRQAYGQHSPLPVWTALETTRRQLAERLGFGWRVELAYLYGDPALEAQLHAWLEGGYGTVALLPLDITETTRSEIASLARRLSLGRQADIRIAPATHGLPEGIYQSSLQALYGDTRPPLCPDIDQATVETLAEHVRQLGPE